MFYANRDQFAAQRLSNSRKCDINFQDAKDFICSLKYSNPGDCSSAPIKTSFTFLVDDDDFMHLGNGKTSEGMWIMQKRLDSGVGP